MGFDRGKNPHDGSRRRLKSEEHKSVKDYKREKLKMPDITKCTNDFCTLKDRCYRYICDDWHWQEYDCYKPDADGKCDFFISEKPTP